MSLSFLAVLVSFDLFSLMSIEFKMFCIFHIYSNASNLHLIVVLSTGCEFYYVSGLFVVFYNPGTDGSYLDSHKNKNSFIHSQQAVMEIYGRCVFGCNHILEILEFKANRWTF